MVETKMMLALCAVALCLGITITVTVVTVAMHNELAVKPSTMLAGIVGLCIGLFISLTGI